jgi:hypothetical protein
MIALNGSASAYCMHAPITLLVYVDEVVIYIHVLHVFVVLYACVLRASFLLFNAPKVCVTHTM